MTEAPPQRVTPPGKRLSIILAVLVHVALIAFLVYGIRWQTQIQDVVEVVVGLDVLGDVRAHRDDALARGFRLGDVTPPRAASDDGLQPLMVQTLGARA